MSIQQIQTNMTQMTENLKQDSLNVLEIEGKRSVRRNFEEEGRPLKWLNKKRPDGRNILRGRTNRLFNTINSTKDTQALAVKISSNLPYSKVHQEGATFQRKPGTVKLRKTRSGQMRFSSTTGKTVKTKAGTVVIPARPFMVIPPVDFPKITNKLSKLKINF